MTSIQGLAERILPARGAAQKATASFAEQLTDSPGRSDVDSPSSSNPFREPAQRTKAVKYRYSATGKHLSSPLKGSSSSPESTSRKSKRAKLTTMTPPSSRAANPIAHAVATTSRKRKASISPCRREDVLSALFVSPPSPLSSPPTSPTLSTTDLPPLSALATQGPEPSRRIAISKTLSLRTVGPPASKFSTFSPPLSPSRKQKKTKPAVKEAVLDGWDIGNFVWVLVNQSGVLVNNATQTRSDLDSGPFMWWPAQVVQKQPLRVAMFGDAPSSSSSSRGLCTIFAPSLSNVQPINDVTGARRFSRATFLLTSSIDNDASLPSKKPRLGESASIADRWESAVQSMEKASTLEQDGLPALLSSYATTGDSFDDSDPDISDLRQSLFKPTAAPKKPKLTDPTRKLKRQRSRANLRDDVGGSAPRSWSPCPPDLTLQIPGELILAMAPKTGSFYWPAQVLAHVPNRKEKYRVKFLDDEEHEITRDKFWTSEEKGFVQCTLGEWESAVKTIEDPDSGDEDDDANAEDPYDTNSALPPPPAPEDFANHPVRAQLAYVKPVLQAILNKEYAPARARHEAFMKGGSGRTALLKSAGVRGGMDAHFVKGVQKAICEWVLGEKGVKPEKLDTEDVVVTEPEEGACVKAISPDAASVATLPRDSTADNTLEGVEGVVVSEDGHTDKNVSIENRALPLSGPDRQPEVVEDFAMAVDGNEQQTVPLPPLANGVTLSPAIQQASLALKSQLDLLAEVSQAVATEPSLLPSHPELPRLKVDLLDRVRKDTSPPPNPLTPVPDEDQQMFCQRRVLVVCEEFKNLSAVEKLDYCLNILLPESIRQLLLWRTGERTNPALLSAEEEQRLHDAGARKAAETDWVDDVMRLRAAQARLWGIDPNKKAEEKMEVEGGTRSRPRRGTFSRP